MVTNKLVKPAMKVKPNAREPLFLIRVHACSFVAKKSWRQSAELDKAAKDSHNSIICRATFT